MGRLFKYFKIQCCGKTYSVKDSETYNYLEIYKHKPTKGMVENKLVQTEYTVLLNGCIDNNCFVAKILRFNNNNLLQEVYLKGKNLKQHLLDIDKTRKTVNIPSPVKKEKIVLKYIPLKYGKKSKNENTQNIVYLDSYNTLSGETHYSECAKYCKI